MTCLVSENSVLAGPGYHAPECIATLVYYGYHSRGQGTDHQTRLNHNEPVEAIE